MNRFILNAALTVVAAGLWSLNLDSQDHYKPTLASPANAVVGRPLTPGSVAGVARRTTRRTVYATNASQQQAQQQQQQAQQQQAAQSSALPKGTVVSALPQGCTSMTVDGVNLFNCGGVTYQPKFQSNNLVYVVM